MFNFKKSRQDTLSWLYIGLLIALLSFREDENGSLELKTACAFVIMMEISSFSQPLLKILLQPKIASFKKVILFATLQTL